MKKLPFEPIDKDTPPEMLKSEKFESGDRVNWLDPISKELKAGTLWMRHQVVAETGLDPYAPIKDVDYWSWDILGDDDAPYGFREEYLIHEKEGE